MKIGGIKFDKDTFITVKVDDGTITMSVTDEAGEKTDYNVTPVAKRSTKKKTVEEDEEGEE